MNSSPSGCPTQVYIGFLKDRCVPCGFERRYNPCRLISVYEPRSIKIGKLEKFPRTIRIFTLLRNSDHRAPARRCPSTAGVPRWHADCFPFAGHLGHLTFEDTDIPIRCEDGENLSVLHRGEIAGVTVPCPVYGGRDFMFIEPTL